MRPTAVLASLLLVALSVAACGDDTGGGATASPSVASSPTRAAAATPTPDASTVRQMSIGAAVSRPGDLALIIATGCWQCDGPTEALHRIVYGPGGSVETAEVLTAAQRAITGYAARGDGGALFVTMCARGRCAHVGPPTADAQTEVLRSDDGGVTWRSLGVIDGSFAVAGILGEGVLLHGPFDPAGQAAAGFQLFPSGERPVAPAGADPLNASTYADREVVWSRADGSGYLRADGSVLVELPPGAEASPSGVVLAQPSSDAERFALVWYEEVDGLPRYFLGAGTVGGGLDRTYALPEGFALAGAWADDHTLIGNSSVDETQLPRDVLPEAPFFADFLPALFDLDAGVIHPITTPFLKPPYLDGRNIVIAVPPRVVLRPVED